ncbi:hypothetical protein F4778DRAFT_604546 [Xylariomycetidae sp. FL2044]|nr:hypothetical protein F4778DRAFT_604546 [Xylariomycetidae sp. FL2044]
MKVINNAKEILLSADLTKSKPKAKPKAKPKTKTKTGPPQGNSQSSNRTTGHKAGQDKSSKEPRQTDQSAKPKAGDKGDSRHSSSKAEDDGRNTTRKSRHGDEGTSSSKGSKKDHPSNCGYRGDGGRQDESSEKQSQDTKNTPKGKSHSREGPEHPLRPQVDDIGLHLFEETTTEEGCAPTAGEYWDFLVSLELLSVFLTDVSSTISHYCRCAPCREFSMYWDQIYRTMSLIGKAAENVHDTVKNEWRIRLRKRPDLGYGKWENAMAFHNSSIQTIDRCRTVLVAWDVRKPRPCCQELYQVVREFPIPLRMKDESNWRKGDEELCAQYGIYAGFVNQCQAWLYGDQLQFYVPPDTEEYRMPQYRRGYYSPSLSSKEKSFRSSLWGPCGLWGFYGFQVSD